MKHKQIITTCVSLAICFGLFSSVNTFANKTDIEQEISIKSDRQSGDLKNKTVDYVDNVVITQGTLSIKADLVKIFRTKNASNVDTGDTYLAKGNPAIFQQTLDDGSIITLEANKITYQPSLFLIKISGNAKVTQASSEVSGSEITYNIATERLDAISHSNEQVTTILQPSALKKDESNKDKADTSSDNPLDKPSDQPSDNTQNKEGIKTNDLSQEKT